jgi:2-dehydro-3-deoxygluconokinase
MHVLAIGECMVELAPTGNGTFAMGYAGDTFNTAWYLRRLLPGSATVSYLSAVGTDSISDRMVEFMAAEGIATDHIQRVPGRSVGLYLIQLTEGERSFAYWRSTSAARLLAEESVKLDAALKGADLIYLSGITLAILDGDARSRLKASLIRARAAGSRVAFDPNIRPALWPDRATMLQSITDMAAAADIVLPSFDDEASHFGDPDPNATAQRYAGKGDRLVVVKDGERPVVTWHDGRSDRHPVPAPTAPVLDTTAAGDSFNAGFLASYLAKADVPTAVAAGVSLAARVIAGPGALVRSAIEPAR